MANGRNLDVHHPDFVARARTGRCVIVYKLDDTFEVVDLLLVAGLEVPIPEIPERLSRTSPRLGCL
ncbi:MAG: hypothetical protein AABZ12_08210 [Planctomycetota bacterium]